ncbi:unnamed protein product [Lymnaea stagnalis]|uniref:Uncharacterized protein n=1 Tax=Lymnaea stagnalis TaxID=6523 RepID=A0AAV2HXC6_LYMST
MKQETMHSSQVPRLGVLAPTKVSKVVRPPWANVTTPKGVPPTSRTTSFVPRQSEKINMATDNVRRIYKPPRRQPGALQTLPTYPWMFNWPMNAYERARLTHGAPCSTAATDQAYKKNWQFRDHTADYRTHPEFVDLRGGPSNLKNATEYNPKATPFPEAFGILEKPKNLFEECDYFVQLQRDNKVWDDWMKRFGKQYHYYNVE